MKKLFMLVALMFGLASCQNEPEDLNVVVGGEQDVMLTVSLPESTRGASSAGFDFTEFDKNSKYDLRFILEISYNGKVVREVETTETTSATFPVRLAPEKEYTFTVWADLVNEDSNADLFYNTAEGLSNIKINLDKWTPNVEARDAYYLSMKKTFNAAADLSMELKRPFAKVRVVATDIKKVTDFDLNPTSAVASYSKQMYTSFNALTGVKAGLANVEHSFKYAEVDTYTDKAGERTVFADYIFVPEDGTVQFTLNIYADEAKSNLINDNAFNTPIYVEKNKVTSIVGDVLTEGGNVKVTVDSTLGEKETINYVNSANSLQETINKIEDGKSGNVKLGGNIDLGDIISIGTLSTRAAEPTYGLLIPAGKSVVLDLNGFTISHSKECKASYSMIQNNGNLTIIDSSEAKSGKISFKDTSAGDPTFGWGSYTLRNEGTLVVENGTIKHLGEQNPGNGQPNVHMYCAIFQYSGKSTINGGVISTPTYRSARLWNGEMTINGGQFVGQLWLQAVSDNANLVINGGEFTACGNDGSSVFVTNDTYSVNFAVTGGNFITKIGMSKPFGCITGGTFTTAAKENTAAALINDDYAWVEAENGLWTVALKNVIAKIGETEYRVLQKAFDDVDNGTIVLQDNVTLNAPAVLAAGKTATLNLNGKEIVNTNASKNYGESEGIVVYGNLTIEGEGTIQGASMAVWARGGNGDAVINIKGGTFKGCQEGLAEGGRAVIYASSNNTVNIYGGEFKALAADKTSFAASQYPVLNVADNKGMINVYGGRFHNQNPAAPGTEPAAWNAAHPYGFVAEGYGATEENGVWTVAKAYEITDNVYTITSAAGLFWVANEVNSGANYFEGKTIKLGADIDLNNAEWTPIGSASKDHGFMGNFDGNGKIIKNLKITNIALDADGYAYAGLFGVTEGIDKDNQNYIKNLTIENVNIKTTGHIVAAAIAYPYYTALENIKVQGKVSIKGGDYTSGVLAYTRRCVDAKDIAIAANEGSVVDGLSTIGGVISDIQMNGGLTANYSNFAASGLTVKGTTCVGGISGILAKQTLNGATVENVTIVCDDVRKGIVSGSLGEDATLKDVVVNNVTGADYYVGATYKAGSTHTLDVDGVVYEYLANGQIKVNGNIIIANGVILKEAGEYIISNAAGMFWFANEVNVNKNAFSGKIVKLGADINLENAAWTPVGQTGATQFKGTFDGNSKIISNLNIDATAQTGANYSSGLFGWLNAAKVKNVTINGAVVKGNHNVGVIAGYLETSGCTIEACNITDAVVEGHHATNDACGDKVGGIVGHAGNSGVVVKDCVISSSTISAGRDAGQVAGAAKTDNVIGCSANNVTVTANGECTGANIRNEVIGRLL